MTEMQLSVLITWQPDSDGGERTKCRRTLNCRCEAGCTLKDPLCTVNLIEITMDIAEVLVKNKPVEMENNLIKICFNNS